MHAVPVIMSEISKPSDSAVLADAAGALHNPCAAYFTVPLQVTKAEWACQDKAQGRSTCEVLMELAEANNLDLLVVGSFGRKGEQL